MNKKFWADYEEPEEKEPTRYYLTVGNFKELLQEVLAYPAAVSGNDYDFVSSLAELDEDELLSWKQVEWLNDIEGKIE